MQIRGRANRKHLLHTVGRQAKDLGLEKNYSNKKVIFCCHSPDLQLITCFSQGIESAPEQPFNSVCQTECPTPKSQCNADNAYSKARGYRGGLCIEKGEGAIGDENTDGHWQHCLLSALQETATGTHRELHQASTWDDHRDEGKTHWKNGQWMVGI